MTKKNDDTPEEGEEIEGPAKPGFLDTWLGQGGRVADPGRLSPFTIDNDKWDRLDFERLLGEIQEFDAHRDKLCDTVETGNGLWADTFWMFKKVEPKPMDAGEIRPKYMINKAITDEAMGLTEFEELRTYTPGDDIAAVMAAITVEPTLENLHDKMKKQQELLDKLEKEQQELAAAQQEQHDLDQMVQDAMDAADPDDEDAQAAIQNMQEQQALINAQVQALMDQAGQTGEQVDEAMQGAKPMIRAAMKEALKDATDEAAAVNQSSSMWGLEPGQIQKMNAAERLKLAKRLDNDKFRKMADLFGPMSRLMWTEQKRKVFHAVDEVYDLELGNDLSRVIASEFLYLDDPLLQLDFFRRYIDGELTEFKLRGDEKVAKGGIICCLDNSGSMSGTNEMWGKAVALCLLHLARQQKRSFRGIHFGSPGRIKCYDFVQPDDFKPDHILDYAEYFEGGGTDFVTPLSKAVDYLKTEHTDFGGIKGDIVFITDGICGVPQPWLEEFLKTKDELGFTLWGLLIGGMSRKTEPLSTLAAGKVANVKDLLSGGDVKDLFGGV